MLEWTTDEALQFVVSAGASAPDRMPFDNPADIIPATPLAAGKS
jgi:uncharacterized membrane protein